MSFRIATAVTAGVIALALPVATAQHTDRSKDQMFKVAQYCVPDEGEPGTTSDLYCLMYN
jgi:hypothetical protein